MYLVQHLLLASQLLVCLAVASATKCDKQKGPDGAAECLKNGQNGKSEWTTCLKNSYIKQNSAGKKECTDKSSTYCQYKCTQESRNLGTAVMNDCYCDPISAAPLNHSLPSWCYNPSGATCNWYEGCLEKRYPCKDKSSDYAIKYAKRFCGLYDASYQKFSAVGKKWVDAVRKCLQISLVPLIRPWHKQTCSAIQKAAFGSHTCCYTGGSSCSTPGSPSICGLPALDWWRVFWTIKSAFVLSTTSAWESVKGVLGTMKACGTDLIRGRQDVAQFQLTVKPSSKTFGLTLDADKLAFETGQRIADKMNWETDGIDWFAYAVQSANQNQISGEPLIIRIIIANKESLLQFTASKSAESLKRRVSDLTKVVMKGGLQFDAASQKTFAIENVQDCLDFACSSVSAAVKSHNRGSKPWDGFYLVLLPLVLLRDW